MSDSIECLPHIKEDSYHVKASIQIVGNIIDNTTKLVHLFGKRLIDSVNSSNFWDLIFSVYLTERWKKADLPTAGGTLRKLCSLRNADNRRKPSRTRNLLQSHDSFNETAEVKNRFFVGIFRTLLSMLLAP